MKEVYGYIKKAAPKAESIILDGELLLVDTKTHQPLPFGTLNVHKKNNFAGANVCVYIFDICYLNGNVLLEDTIEDRRTTMQKYVKVRGSFVIFLFLICFRSSLIVLKLVNFMKSKKSQIFRFL